MAPTPFQRLLAIRFFVFVAGIGLSADAGHAAWPAVPPLSSSPPKSQFASHELYLSDASYEVPYYLRHFAQVANSVVETGFNRVETNGTSSTIVTNFYPRGFLDIRVNRDTRDNRPYNARIMEMQMALAYFYTADRPWNDAECGRLVRRILGHQLEPRAHRVRRHGGGAGARSHCRFRSAL